MPTEISKEIIDAMNERAPFEAEIACDTAKPAHHFPHPAVCF